MKNFNKINLLLAVFLVSAVFLFLPKNDTSAATTGYLVRMSGGRDVYYVAQDNKKYLIPDAKTFYTWYGSFSNIKVLAKKDFNNIKTGSVRVTVRPGSSLVKFVGNKNVYVVLKGASLRKVADKQMAKGVFTESWYKSLVVLPAKDISDYSIGDNLEAAEQYDANYQRGQVKTIDDALIAQGIIPKPSSVNTSSTVLPNSKLKSLGENLSAGFSPGFKSGTLAYTIAAKYTETKITLTPTAYDNQTIIKINGLSVNSKQSLSVNLSEGSNVIKIEVNQPNARAVTYVINVFRTSPESSSYLKSLIESASGSLSPAFSRSVYTYTLQTKNTEGSVDITPTVESTKAKLYMNNQIITSGKKQTIGLDPGDNEIKFKVVAEDGATRTYTLTVNRSPYVDISDSFLQYIKVSISSGLSPSFSNDETEYYVRAKSTDKQVQLWTAPKSSSAIVSIDGIQRKTVTYALQGLQYIVIQVLGPSGNKREYHVTVQQE